MLNRKKLFLPILICILIISSMFSIIVSSSADSSVQLSYELNAEYTKGLTISLPKAEDDGVELKHKLTYPDGRTTSYEKVTLDQTGEYTLVYYVESPAESGAVKKTFIVKDSFSSLFTCADGVEIVGETDIPSYINVDSNTLDGAGVKPAEFYGNKSGVKFKANKKGAVINYNGIVDLNKLNCTFSTTNAQWWNKLDTSFIELLITPEDNSKREFNYLEITLTDIYDPTNYLTIDVTAAEATVSSSMTSCYVAAAPKGMYDSVGKPASSLQGPISTWGTSVRSTFYGQIGTTDTDSIRLFFDNSDNSLFTMPVTPDRYPCEVFRNFANPDLVGLENLWYGFTTGEVYLSIKVGDLLMQEASFMVLSINGQNINSDYQTGSAESQIIINYGEYQGGEIPYGVAGENTTYPIFDAIACNKVTGVLNKPNVNVYYVGEDGSLREPVIVANDRFKTEKVGKYNIVYTSQTIYGKAEEVVTVNVLSKYNDQDKLSIKASDEISTQAFIGDVVYLYDAVAQGGVGTLNIESKAYYNSPTGKQSVALDEGGLYPIFVAEKEGEYILEFTVTDELGVSKTETIIVNSSYHETPYIIDPTIPYHVKLGRTIKLPVTTANYVDSTGAYQTQVKVMVDGVDYTNKDYTVTGDFTIDYVATVIDNPSITSTKSFNVKGTGFASGNEYFASFFYAKDTNGDSKNDCSYFIENGGAIFATSVNGATVEFSNYIPVQLLTMTFYLPDENDSLDRFNIYVSDSMNKNERIKLSIVKVENEGKYYSMFAINDQILSTISGAFSSSTSVPFGVVFNESKNLFIDGDGKSIGVVENYANGQKFNGFSSQMVYVDFEFVLKSEELTSVRISNIGGQSFSARQQEDEGRPTLVVLEDVPTNRFSTIGEKIYVPKCYAYDVLGNITEFSCKIHEPNGNAIEVDKFDGTFFITADKVGVYRISFSAKDDNNNKMRATDYYITVQENNAPTIEVGSAKTSYKVGDKLEMPSVSASDDTTEKPMIIAYIESPNFVVSSSVENYTFNMAGKYTLYIYSYDNFANFTIEKIVIMVNE